MGLWLKYNQKSAVSLEEWRAVETADIPKLKANARLYFGVKYSKVSGNVSLAVAVKTDDGKIFVEAVDCRNIRGGNSWIIEYLRNPKAAKIAVDGAGNQDILAEEMKNAFVKCRAILPTVKEVINANALLEKNLFDGRICHKGQPALTQAISNCEHRAIGNAGGFGYSSILEGADVSLVEAVSLAHWLCANSKENFKQKISY